LRVEYREKNEMHEEQVVDLDRERQRQTEQWQVTSLNNSA